MTSPVETTSPDTEDVEPQDARLLSEEQVTPVMEKMQIEELVEEIRPSSAPRVIEVDSLVSWLVAVSCSWIMFWSLLVNRTSGLLYLSLKNEFNMTREEAAAPMSMAGAISNIFAMVSGLLLKKLPLPVVSSFGIVLTSIGVLLAGAIYTPIVITYSLGILTAIGQSMIFPTNMVAVNTYFKKNRSTASGISYMGGTLVSFFMPFAYEAMEQSVGFRWTLLITGALILNGVFGACVLRYPAQNTEKEPKDNNNVCDEENKTVAKSDAAPMPLSAQLAFIKRPIFLLIVVTGIVFAYELVLFNLTVVAFANEKDLAGKGPLFTLWFYAAGDAIGRLFSGQLSDRGVLRRRTVMALGYLLVSIATFGLALSSHQIVFFLFCFLFGLAAGSIMILFSVLLTEYLGLANLPLAIGVHCLINGLAALPRPKLFKILVKNETQHIALYYFMALIAVATAVVWGLHCLYMNIRKHFGRLRRHPRSVL
ncbi:monocarboxylate transporter 12 [Galendromus occidentalis]|uniref:Monocarboxylate transporter 12 n=1 Tax=Galendromus occidentalis TaxID=34638 RepID=A0AAJ7L8V6_9ACAR|nr:monocarboxylate transporter 12 [Galendromus occidentalis]